MTELCELEDRNTLNLETRGPIHFQVLSAYIFHRRFHLNIKLLSSYANQPLHIF